MTESKKKRISLSINENIANEVDKVVKKKGINRSAIFTLALEDYLRKEKEKNA